MSTPFGTSLRRNPEDPRRLWERIDAQIAERIEDALDSACLDLLVERRRARGLPMPAANDPADRAEFEELVAALLDRLAGLAGVLLTPEQRSPITAAEAAGSPGGRRLGVQIALAKLLPDYWQRFEEVRLAFAAERRTAGSPRRLFGRLFPGGKP